ncbi:iron-sulfur cluster assembly scaffold protein [Agaribacterium sp. ZY112]|uniref:iron-sulfur cluster assembly scaffold protein n=1 Tax=Agaribacterium sp. ZY112 TaxID=3233574 RepID=UPI0035232669
MSELALYQQQLLALHKQPFGFKQKLENAEYKKGSNLACGDVIELQVKREGDAIKAVAFDGDSCAICRASASLLCEHLADTNVQNARTIYKALQGYFSEEQDQLPEPYKALTPIRAFPVRVQCAMLPWTSLLELLESKEHAN